MTKKFLIILLLLTGCSYNNENSLIEEEKSSNSDIYSNNESCNSFTIDVGENEFTVTLNMNNDANYSYSIRLYEISNDYSNEWKQTGGITTDVLKGVNDFKFKLNENKIEIQIGENYFRPKLEIYKQNNNGSNLYFNEHAKYEVGKEIILGYQFFGNVINFNEQFFNKNCLLPHDLVLITLQIDLK